MELQSTWVTARIYTVSPDLGYCRALADGSDELFGFPVQLLNPTGAAEVHLNDIVELRIANGFVVEAQTSQAIAASV